MNLIKTTINEETIQQYYNVALEIFIQQNISNIINTYQISLEFQNNIMSTIQMSGISSGLQLSEQSINKPPKSKAEYSRNVKKLKLKLKNISQQISDLEKKIDIFKNTSNDKMIALKVSKFCRQRKMTPEMLYRFADRKNTKKISRQTLHQCFQKIGLKLSQNEMKRMEYLIDEDLSGDITWNQYNRFLHVFGVKAEYSPDDNFLKDALKKLDIGKILGLAEDQKMKRKKDPNKHRQLLNYEEFMKYCHRHFSQLKNKEIAGIFNRLEKNGFIDLEDFLDYIKQKQENQKKLNEKNKKKKGQKQVEGVVDETSTLKGIIKALIRHRPKDSKSLFHSSQFQRLQKILQKPKGQIIQLFKQIDKKKRGSFGFSQLVQYFVAKSQKNYMVFVYQLMGRKISIIGEKPEDTLKQYNNQKDTISNKQFYNFCQKQFQLSLKDSEMIYKLVGKDQTSIPVRLILDAMKLQEGQKKTVYIKPTMWDTAKKDYFKKNSLTIYFNPFVALRSCISIMEQLNKVKQHFWDDFQFGPTFQDPTGIYSIGLGLPQDSVKWNTVASLQMEEFYFPTTGKVFKSTPLCSHDIFTKALAMLVQQSESFLWNKEKLDFNKKDLEEKDLEPLFSGLYPLVFHQFAKYGLYVLKFFVRQKWAYVLIDNKIPCNLDNQPLFSTSFNNKLAWVSLAQKAYAKIRGSYQRIFQPATSKHYLYELSRYVALDSTIQSKFDSEDKKNSLWKNIQQKTKISQNKFYSLTTDENAMNLIQSNIQTGLQKNRPYKIDATAEIKDSTCQNSHKSHRLLILKSFLVKNETQWNFNWSMGSSNKNKFSKFQDSINSEINQLKKDITLTNNKDYLILNYKLFRSIFNRILYLHKVSFEKTVVLRKVVEFEEKINCKYELSCIEKQPNKSIKFIVALNRLKSPSDTTIQLKLKDGKGTQLVRKQIKSMFGSQEFQVTSATHYLEIGVSNWHTGQDHAYTLTFYMLNPRYHLKELDRQLLFKFVSPYEEAYHLNIKKSGDKQRKFIYRNFYRGAQRGTTCCC